MWDEQNTQEDDDEADAALERRYDETACLFDDPEAIEDESD